MIIYLDHSKAFILRPLQQKGFQRRSGKGKNAELTGDCGPDTELDLFICLDGSVFVLLLLYLFP
jgi:hypothetical protein